MKQKLRRVLSLILAAAMILSLLPASAEEVGPGTSGGTDGDVTETPDNLTISTDAASTWFKITLDDSGNPQLTFQVSATGVPDTANFQIYIVLKNTLLSDSRVSDYNTWKATDWRVPSTLTEAEIAYNFSISNIAPMWSIAHSVTGNSGTAQFTNANVEETEDVSKSTFYNSKDGDEFLNWSEVMNDGGAKLSGTPQFVALIGTGNGAFAEVDVELELGAPRLEADPMSITFVNVGIDYMMKSYQLTNVGNKDAHIRRITIVDKDGNGSIVDSIETAIEAQIDMETAIGKVIAVSADAPTSLSISGEPADCITNSPYTMTVYYDADNTESETDDSRLVLTFEFVDGDPFFAESIYEFDVYAGTVKTEPFSAMNVGATSDLEGNTINITYKQGDTVTLKQYGDSGNLETKTESISNPSFTTPITIIGNYGENPDDWKYYATADVTVDARTYEPGEQIQGTLELEWSGGSHTITFIANIVPKGGATLVADPAQLIFLYNISLQDVPKSEIIRITNVGNENAIITGVEFVDGDNNSSNDAIEHNANNDADAFGNSLTFATVVDGIFSPNEFVNVTYAYDVQDGTKADKTETIVIKYTDSTNEEKFLEIPVTYNNATSYLSSTGLHIKVPYNAVADGVTQSGTVTYTGTAEINASTITFMSGSWNETVEGTGDVVHDGTDGTTPDANLASVTFVNSGSTIASTSTYVGSGATSSTYTIKAVPSTHANPGDIINYTLQVAYTVTGGSDTVYLNIPITIEIVSSANATVNLTVNKSGSPWASANAGFTPPTSAILWNTVADNFNSADTTNGTKVALSNGRCTFSDVKPGSYDVYVQVDSEWVKVNSNTVTAVAGVTSVVTANFFSVSDASDPAVGSVAFTANASDTDALTSAVSTLKHNDGKVKAALYLTDTTNTTDNNVLDFAVSAANGVTLDTTDHTATYTAPAVVDSTAKTITFPLNHTTDIEVAAVKEPEPTTGSATVNLTLNGSSTWSNVALPTGSVVLTGATTYTESISAASVNFTDVNFDTYTISVGGVDTGKTVTVSANPATASVNYVTVILNKDADGDVTGSNVTGTYGSSNTNLADGVASDPILADVATTESDPTVTFAVAVDNTTDYRLDSPNHAVDNAAVASSGSGTNYTLGLRGATGPVYIYAKVVETFVPSLTLKIDGTVVSAIGDGLTEVKLSNGTVTYSTTSSQLNGNSGWAPASPVDVADEWEYTVTYKTVDYKATVSKGNPATISLYNVSFASSITNGTVTFGASGSNDTDAKVLRVGDTTGVTITAAGTNGYAYGGWTVKCGDADVSTNNKLTIPDSTTASGKFAIGADFAEVGSITLTPVFTPPEGDIELQINVNGNKADSTHIREVQLNGTTILMATGSGNEGKYTKENVDITQTYTFTVTMKDGSVRTVVIPGNSPEADRKKVLNLYTVTVASGAGTDAAPKITELNGDKLDGDANTAEEQPVDTAYVEANSNDKLKLDTGTAKTGYTLTGWEFTNASDNTLTPGNAYGTISQTNVAHDTYNAGDEDDAITLTLTYTWGFDVKVVDAAGNAFTSFTTAHIKVHEAGEANAANVTVAASGTAGVFNITGLDTGESYDLYVNGYKTTAVGLDHDEDGNSDTFGAGDTVEIKVAQLKVEHQYVTSSSTITSLGSAWTNPSNETAPSVIIGTSGNTTSTYIPASAEVTLTASSGEANRYTEHTKAWTSGTSNTDETLTDNSDNTYTYAMPANLTENITLHYNVIPAWKVTLASAAQAGGDCDPASSYSANVNGGTSENSDDVIYVQIASVSGSTATSDSITLGEATNNNAFVFKGWMSKTDGDYAALTLNNGTFTVTADTTIAPISYMLPTISGGGWTYNQTSGQYDDNTAIAKGFIWTPNDATYDGENPMTVTYDSGSGTVADQDPTDVNGNKMYTPLPTDLNNWLQKDYTVTFNWTIFDKNDNEVEVEPDYNTATFKVTGTKPTLTRIDIKHSGNNNNPADVDDTISYSTHSPQNFDFASVPASAWVWYYADAASTQTILGTQAGAGSSSAQGESGFSGSAGGKVTTTHAGKYIYATVTVDHDGDSQTPDVTFYTNAIPVYYDAYIEVLNYAPTSGRADLSGANAVVVLDDPSTGNDAADIKTTRVAEGVYKAENLTPGVEYQVKAPITLDGTTLAEVNGVKITGVKSGDSETTPQTEVKYYQVSRDESSDEWAHFDNDPATPDDHLGTMTDVPEISVHTPTDTGFGKSFLQGTDVRITSEPWNDDYVLYWKGTDKQTSAQASSDTEGYFIDNISSPHSIFVKLEQNTYDVPIYVYGTGAIDVITVEKTGTKTATFNVLITGSSDNITASTGSGLGAIKTFKTVAGSYTVTTATPVTGNEVTAHHPVENGTVSGTDTKVFTVDDATDGIQIVLATVELALTATDSNATPNTVTANWKVDEPVELIERTLSMTYNQSNPTGVVTINFTNTGTGTLYNIKATEKTDHTNCADGKFASGSLTHSQLDVAPGATSATTFTIEFTNLASLTAGQTYTVEYTFTFKDASGADAPTAETITYKIDYTVNKAKIESVTVKDQATLLTDGIEAGTKPTVGSVTADFGTPQENTDVTYEWFYEIGGSKHSFATGWTATDEIPDAAKGGYIYVVATGINNYTGAPESAKIPVKYDAEIKVKKDGDTAGVVANVEIVDNATGDVVCTVTTAEGVGKATGLVPGKTYNVEVAKTLDTNDTAYDQNVATITVVGDAPVINYWTLVAPKLDVLHATTDGQHYTSTDATNKNKTLINPTDGLDDLPISVSSHTVGTVVLHNTEVTYEKPSYNADYEFEWTVNGSGSNSPLKVKATSTATATVAATLTQNTYPVTFTADEAAITSVTVTRSGVSGNVASWTGTAASGTLAPQLPLGEYTVTVDAPGYVINSITDRNDPTNTNTTPTDNTSTCTLDVVSNGEKTNGVDIEVVVRYSELTLTDRDTGLNTGSFGGVYGNLSADTIVLDLKNGGSSTLNGTLLIEKIETNGTTTPIYDSSSADNGAAISGTKLTISNHGDFSGLTSATSPYNPPLTITIPATLEVSDSAQYRFTYKANDGSTAIYTLTVTIKQADLTEVSTSADDFSVAQSVAVNDPISVDGLKANHGDPQVATDATYEWFIKDGNQFAAVDSTTVPSDAAGKYIYVVATGIGNYKGDATSVMIPVKYDAYIKVVNNKVDGTSPATDLTSGKIILDAPGNGTDIEATSQGNGIYKAAGLLPDVEYQVMAPSTLTSDDSVVVTNVKIDSVGNAGSEETPGTTINYYEVTTGTVTVNHYNSDGTFSTTGNLGTMTGVPTIAVTSPAANTSYLQGTTVKVTSTTAWSDDYDLKWNNTGNEQTSGEAYNVGYEITAIKAAETVTATLKQNVYPITVTVRGSGTVDSFDINADSPAIEDVSKNTNDTAAGYNAQLNHTSLPIGKYTVDALALVVGTQLAGYSTDGTTVGNDASFTVTKEAGGDTIYIHVIQPTLQLEVEDGTDSGTATYSTNTTSSDDFTKSVEVVYGTADDVSVTLKLTNTGSGTLYDVKGTAGDGDVFTVTTLPDDTDMPDDGDPYTLTIEFDPNNKTVGDYEDTFTFEFAANDRGSKTSATVKYTYKVTVVQDIVTDLHVTPPKTPAVGENPNTVRDLTLSEKDGTGTPAEGSVTTATNGVKAGVAEIKSITWYEGSTPHNGVFAAGATYKAVVTVDVINSNYRFTDTGDTDYTDYVAKYADASGNNPTVKVIDADTIELTYTFGATAPKTPEVNATGLGSTGPSGRINWIKVDSEKDVTFTWIVTKELLIDPKADDVLNPAGNSIIPFASGVTPNVPTVSNVAEWTNTANAEITPDNSGTFDPGTTYYVYAVAVYTDDTNQTNPSAVGSTTFKTWHKVVVTATNGTVTTPQTVGGTNVVYVAAGASTTVAATPISSQYKFKEWTVDNNDSDDDPNGGFTNVSTDSSTDITKATFTVAADANPEIEVTATFDGISDIEWETPANRPVQQLPKGYNSDIKLVDHNLHNLGVATTGTITFSYTITGKLASDPNTEVTIANPGNYIKAEMPSGVTTIDGEKFVEVTVTATGNTSTGATLAPGTYSIVVTAKNGETSDTTDLIISMTVANDEVALLPEDAYWDLNGGNLIVTDTDSDPDTWLIKIYGSAQGVEQIKYLGIGGSAPSVTGTALGTGNFTSDNSSITFTEGQVKTIVENSPFAESKAKPGETIWLEVKLNGKTETYNLRIHVIDTTPIVYEVEIDPSTVSTAGVQLTAKITSAVDSDWHLGKGTNTITPESTAAIPVADVTAGKVLVDWYVSNGTGWDLVQDSSTTNSVNWTIPHEHMGKRVKVVVTDVSADTTYRPSSTLAGTDANYPVVAYATPNLSVIAKTADSNGTITIPGVTNGIHVTYVPKSNPAYIAASAKPGYVFAGWTIESGAGDFGNDASESTFFVPTENSVVVANFREANISFGPYNVGVVYGTKPTGTLLTVKASSEYVGEKFTYSIKENVGDWSYFDIDETTGAVSVIKKIDVDVNGTTYDTTVDNVNPEMTFTVIVTPTSNTNNTKEFSVTVDVLSNELTIHNTPVNYPDVMAGTAFDKDKLSHLIVREEGGTNVTEGTDKTQFTWSMVQSGFTSATTTYTFTATHNQSAVEATKWNYKPASVDDTINVTDTAVQLKFTDKTGSSNYAPMDVNYSNTDESVIYGSTLPTYTVKLQNTGNVDVYNVNYTVRDADGNFILNPASLPINKDYGHGASGQGAFEEFTVTLNNGAVGTYTIVIEATGNTKDDNSGDTVKATYTLTVEVQSSNISKVVVEVEKPTPGKKLDTTPEPKDPTRYEITEWHWEDKDGNTVSSSTDTTPREVVVDDDDGSYTLVTTVVPKDPNTTFDGNTTFAFEDEDGEHPDEPTPDNPSDSAEIEHTWTITGTEFPIIMNVTAPAKGASPTAPSSANSALYNMANATTDYKWYNSDGTPLTGNFEAGKSYTLWVKVEIVDSRYNNGDVTGRFINDGTSHQLSGPTSFTVGGSGYGTAGTTTNELWYTWTVPADEPVNPTPPPSTPSQKFEVTYVPGPNGTTNDPLTEEVREGGKPKDVPTITPKEDDYVFIGWSTTDPETLGEDENITLVNPEDVVINGPTTFYAVVTKKEIKVNYDLGSFGSTTDPTEEIVAKYQYPSFTPNVTIIESQKDLAKFVGWSLEKPDHVLEVNLVDPLTVQILKDTTFYAVYEITEYEYHEHYMIGYPDGNFEPEQDITRAEVATIIARAVLPDFIEGSWYGDGGYTDLAGGHWALSAIAFTTAAGIFEGYEDGTFRPNQPITRQEYATVIARLKGLLDGNRTDLANFGDVADISEWAIDGVYTCVEEGWIIGYEDSTFKPRKDITRAEAAKMMNGYLNRGVDEPGVSTVPEYIQFPDVYWGHWAYWEVAEAVNDHYYYYYYVDVDGNDIPPEQWVIEAGYLNVKLDDSDPDNTKNVRRTDPIYVNSVSAGTSSSN